MCAGSTPEDRVLLWNPARQNVQTETKETLLGRASVLAWGEQALISASELNRKKKTLLQARKALTFLRGNTFAGPVFREKGLV
jgi:hypothetical protein